MESILRMVSYTNLCTSQEALRSSLRTKRQGTESGPLGHTAAKCSPGGNKLTDPNTLATV